MERDSNNSIDRIECFDNYYSCLQRNEWNLFYIYLDTILSIYYDVIANNNQDFNLEEMSVILN